MRVWEAMGLCVMGNLQIRKIIFLPRENVELLVFHSHSFSFEQNYFPSLPKFSLSFLLWRENIQTPQTQSLHLLNGKKFLGFLFSSHFTLFASSLYLFNDRVYCLLLFSIAAKVTVDSVFFIFPRTICFQV